MFPVTCFLQLGFYLPEVRFYKNRTAISTFSVCRVVSRPIAPSFSMANSLISSDMLSTARERYKKTFTKVIFNIGCSKNRVETENTFLREELVVKNQKGQ